MEKENTLEFRTVYECNCWQNCDTWHPLASVIQLGKPLSECHAVRFGFYTVLLMEDCTDDGLECGRQYCDYTAATAVFLRPGEVFRMNGPLVLPAQGSVLAFHPDLLFHTGLKRHMGDYHFFNYRKEESLHLSQREAEKLTACLGYVADELRQPVDMHTSTILSRYIELFLDYCVRYYERQFITRENGNKFLLEQAERMLNNCMASGELRDRQPLRATCVARELGLSEAYFSDLLKFETGMKWEEYLQMKKLEFAKTMLLQPENTPDVVARQLGYESVRHFYFIFKKMTGMPPDKYLYSAN